MWVTLDRAGGRMLNARPVDKKFWISGGWENIVTDIKWLKEQNIRAVLDLQFIPKDDEGIPETVQLDLNAAGIDYHFIYMYDNYFNVNLEGMLDEGAEFLSIVDQKYTGKKDRILVKCGAGISRSSTQYLNYICKRDGIPFVDVLNKTRDYEANWNLVNSPEGYWRAEPNMAFFTLLARRYPRNGSAFGEVVA